MKSFSFVLIAFLALHVNLFAQSELYYANDAFNARMYKKAIPLYEEAFNKKMTFEAASQLARSYELLMEYRKAEDWYRKAFKMPSPPDSVLPHFARVLQMNGKFDEAKRKYEILSRAKTEGINDWPKYIQACDSALNSLPKPDAYDIYLVQNINDQASDYPTFIKNDILFISSNRSNDVPEYRLLNQENNLPYYSVHVSYLNQGTPGQTNSTPTDKKHPYHEGHLSISNDNRAFLTINQESDMQGKETNKLDIYVGRYNSLNNELTDLVPFEYNTKQYSEGHAHISADGQRLYFVSDRVESIGGTDIFVCTKIGKDWSEPMNIGSSVNTEYDELYPFEKDTNSLYFTSNRPESFGGFDIFASEKIKGYWNEAVHLDMPINSSRDDFSLIFFQDSTKGFFASNREGGKGQDDIYGFSFRNPVFKKSFIDSLAIVTKPATPNSENRLTPNTGDKPDSTSTASNDPNKNRSPDQQATDSKPADTTAQEDKPKTPELTQTQINADTSELKKERSLTFGDLSLNPSGNDSTFNLKGSIIQKIDSEVQPYNGDIVVTLIDTSGKSTQAVTKSNGEFVFEKIDEQLYTIRASKDGYFTKSAELEIRPPFEAVVQNEQNILEKIEYKFDSYELLPEAKRQLDRLHAVMLANKTYKLELSSYTDARGSEQYNLDLSKKRAASVKNYLISKGIPGSRIISIGYGETNLRVKNATTPEQHQLNRRTEFKFITAN